jgi:hypothetical protein
MKKSIVMAMLFLLVPFAASLGSVQTGSIAPENINLCGEHAQYVTITAYQIYNKESVALNSVNARLIVSPGSGLSFVTQQDVNIGSIEPLSFSPASPSWTLQCSSPAQGVITAYVNYTSGGFRGSSIDEAYTLITVHGGEPLAGNISVVETNNTYFSEPDYQVIADNRPTIRVTTTRNAVCKGSLDADKPYNEMDFIFYGTLLEHNYTFVTPVAEGQHIVYVRCKDEQDNIMPQSLEISFIVDTIPPAIEVISPISLVQSRHAELKLRVDEDSECRYHRSNRSFSNMNALEKVNQSTFFAILTNLEENSYDYYVSCRDRVGNIGSTKITFTVRIPPSARIIIEKEPPLSKGTYEVRLLPSTELQSTPYLHYGFTDDPAFSRQISIVKDGSFYKGYIIIEESDRTRAGVFSFRGYDLGGNEGTEITDGAIFLVDTVKPPAPESLQAIATEEGIFLKWHYEGEKLQNFRVYRSSLHGVNYIHHYSQTANQEFIDKNVNQNQLYYYRAAAVDLAGNIGPLSNEVSAYAKSGTEISQPAVNTNPPSQETRDWRTQAMKAADSLLIDLEWALNNLKEQATRESAVDDLGLIRQVMSAKEDVDKLKAQLSGVDLTTITDTSLREALSKGDALIARTKKTVPQSLTLDKSTTVLQATTLSDVELAVSELFSGTEYTESQIKSYVRQMEKINQRVKVESEIKTITIQNIDESSEKMVLVSKKLSYESPEPIKDVIFVEIIPKTVAGDISSIDIRTPGYTVVRENPIVSWSHPELSFEKKGFSYVLMSNDNSESAKTTKAVVLLNPINVIKDGNIMTGFSIFMSRVTSGGLELLGVVLGVIIILGLGMYYMVVVNEVNLGEYLSRLPIIKDVQRRITVQVSDVRMPNIQRQPQTDSFSAVTAHVKSAPAIFSSDNTASAHLSYLFKNDSPVKTIPEQYFHVRNGDVVRSISELSDVIAKMDDFTFFYHVHEDRNDFAKWVETIYHNKELADLIRNGKSRHQLIEVLKELE